MNRIDCDVVILGSGLGGSLLAMVLHRLGRRVVMMDRCVHPRFTIGESSTPIADMLLARVCRRYALPEIAPLAAYGATRRAHPELSIGLKRGFSYFGHTPGQAFQVHPDHRNELLVAASTKKVPMSASCFSGQRRSVQLNTAAASNAAQAALTWTNHHWGSR